MKLKSKTICITGIGGFIGRRVTEMATDRARRELGFLPDSPLDEGMARTEAWLRDQKLI